MLLMLMYLLEFLSIFKKPFSSSISPKPRLLESSEPRCKFPFLPEVSFQPFFLIYFSPIFHHLSEIYIPIRLLYIFPIFLLFLSLFSDLSFPYLSHVPFPYLSNISFSYLSNLSFPMFLMFLFPIFLSFFPLSFLCFFP